MKRHSTDATSLVFGLIFLGIAGWWLVDSLVRISIPHQHWILAGGLILAGLWGVLSSLRRGPQHPDQHVGFGSAASADHNPADPAPQAGQVNRGNGPAHSSDGTITGP